MRAWMVQKFGRPSEVLAIHNVEKPMPGPAEVLVEVEAASINKNDIEGVYGRWPGLLVGPPFTPGCEALGVVVQAPLYAPQWIGKRVVGMPRGAYGAFAEYAVLPTSMAFEVPADMPVDQAAAMFWPFHLAWLGLFTRGKLQAGETVLIHAAAGGAGSAAVQLAVHAGARVIATVGSDEKFEFCRKLGAETVINYRKADLVEEVLGATDGLGVDVAFDSMAGELTKQTWGCLNFGARHVVFGLSLNVDQTDGYPILMRDIIFGNFSVGGAALLYVERANLPGGAGLEMGSYNFKLPSRALGENIHGKLIDLLREGHIRTVVDRQATFEDLPDAMARFESREALGRIIVRL